MREMACILVGDLATDRARSLPVFRRDELGEVLYPMRKFVRASGVVGIVFEEMPILLQRRSTSGRRHHDRPVGVRLESVDVGARHFTCGIEHSAVYL
jgi:hypothetical protein